jgi:hypothetical protein
MHADKILGLLTLSNSKKVQMLHLPDETENV